MTNEQFLAASIPAAQQSQRDTRVPTSVTLAQAILESGWGRSSTVGERPQLLRHEVLQQRVGRVRLRLPRLQHPGMQRRRRLQHDGRHVPHLRHVRRLLHRHGMALKNLARYAAAFNYTGNPNQFVAEVHKGGYATDPLYTTKLVNLMTKYNLYQYDLAL